MRRLLPALALIVASCATLSEEECRSADWRAVGVADGAEGHGPDRLAAHARACARAGVLPDTAAWAAGREAGLRRYCTPEKAHALGRAGRAIAPGCGAAELAAMRPAHQHGEMWWQIGREIEALRAELRAVEAELRRRSPGPVGDVLWLLRERARIEAEIRLLEASRARYARWP